MISEKGMAKANKMCQEWIGNTFTKTTNLKENTTARPKFDRRPYLPATPREISVSYNIEISRTGNDSF